MNAQTTAYCIAALALSSLPARSTEAQTSTQVITYAVNAVNVLAFTGAPSLTIVTAVAGSNPTTITNTTARWAVTTNQTGAKVTASIPTAMPAGLTLSANLAAPTGAASTGYRPLGTTSVDLVTGITKRAQAALVARYRLAATAAAGVISSSSRVVTYTITGGT